MRASSIDCSLSGYTVAMILPISLYSDRLSAASSRVWYSTPLNERIATSYSDSSWSIRAIFSSRRNVVNFSSSAFAPSMDCSSSARTWLHTAAIPDSSWRRRSASSRVSRTVPR